MENALKGWLSTFNHPRRFGHELEEIWSAIEKMELDEEPRTGRHDSAFHQAADSMAELLAHTIYEDPENPGATKNWLSNYAAAYRYGRTFHHMPHEERLELKELVNQALENVLERVHLRSGTTDNDLFPEGFKPWEIRI